MVSSTNQISISFNSFHRLQYHLSMAKKCIKSALFSIGVLVGRPRFFLEPTLHSISSIAGPSFSRSAVTPADISSGVDALNA